MSSSGTLSSQLLKGEIIGSTGITLQGLFVKSTGSSDHLLASLSLFSHYIFFISFSLPLLNYVSQDKSHIFK